MADPELERLLERIHQRKVAWMQKSAWPVIISAIAVGITLISAIVVITVSFTTTTANVTHLEQRVGENKTAISEYKKASDEADREIREQLSRAQESNAQTHQKLTDATTRIETLLEVIAGKSAIRRR